MDDVSGINWEASVTTEGFACSSEFANDGGKLIVLPRSLLGIWYGSTFPWTQKMNAPHWSRIAGFFEELLIDYTDFAIAQGMRDWFDVMQLRRGQAIVFGYGESYGRWLRTLPDGRDYLLAIEYGDQRFERGVADFLRSLPDSAWQDLDLRFEVPDEDLLLFHSGTNGVWLKEVGPGSWASMGTGIAWRIPPGSYALHQASAQLKERGCAGHAEVCWLRPA
jgi:hypothetical protein